MIQWSGNLCCNDNVQTFKPLPLSTTMTYTSWESTQSIAHILYCSNFVQVQGFSRWIANIPHARLVTGKRCPWHPLTMLFQGALKPCRSMTFQTGHKNTVTDGAGSTLSVQKKWQIWTLTNSSIINQTETYKTWKNHRTTFGWNTTFVFRSWGSLQSTWSLAKFQELSIRFVGDDRVNYMLFSFTNCLGNGPQLASWIKPSGDSTVAKLIAENETHQDKRRYGDWNLWISHPNAKLWGCNS